MKLKNNFSTDTRWLFHDCRYRCLECSSNNMVTIHHITGRDSNSPLNACPLCHDCHAKVGHTQEEERNFFEKTMQYLIRQEYKITEKDEQFIRDHPYLVTNFVK